MDKLRFYSHSYSQLLRLSFGLCCLALLTPATANARCWFNCNDDYAQTQYPIVLSHGFLGSDQYLGSLDYWYGIVGHLEARGATVYVTKTSPINSSVVRGEQIIEQLDAIRAIRNEPTLKFNLMGHSQGGIDIRYVGGVRPDLVASLTTIGTPNAGSSLSDLIDELEAGGGIVDGLIGQAGNVMALLWGLLGNGTQPNDLHVAFDTFSTTAMAAFNADPIFGMGAVNSVCGEGEYISDTAAGPRPNYSWTGNAPQTNIFDPLDPLFAITAPLLGGDNDGLVDRCSAHFGQVLRDDYDMNHLDEVNQILGLTALFETDPKSVIRTHANRLKNAGL